MSSTDLESQDLALRTEADTLVARYHVLETLAQFGTPHLSGSYSLRLMTWRDLDFYLEMASPDVGAFLELGRRLGVTLRPRKLAFTDQLNFPTTEALAGLYWGIRTDELSRGGWKIDIWGVTPSVCAERLAHTESLRSSLTPSSRSTILLIKNEVCRLREYRDTVTSQHIYDAVVAHGATSIADFWAFMAAQKART